LSSIQWAVRSQLFDQIVRGAEIERARSVRPDNPVRSGCLSCHPASMSGTSLFVCFA
jgi:hypothetical protein